MADLIHTSQMVELLATEKVIPICKNCYHVRNTYTNADAWTCEAEQNKTNQFSIITGERTLKHDTANWCRVSHTGCGYKGNWFETRETYLYRTSPATEHTKKPKIALSNNHVALLAALRSDEDEIL